MTVNFTGIKNAGAMLIRTPNPYQKLNVLSLQVTNDEDGNDLDKFNEALEKTGKPGNYKTNYDGAVSINVFSTESDEEFGETKYSYYLNGTPLEVKDKNLAMFSFIANLTTNISNKKDKDLRVSEDYIKTPDFLNGSEVGYFIKQIFYANQNVNPLSLIRSAYDPESTKSNAKYINSAIHKTMTDYLA